jgi:hypothetical protein
MDKLVFRLGWLLARGVDVQSNHSGSSHQGCEFDFLLFKKLALGVSPPLSLKKKLGWLAPSMPLAKTLPSCPHT